MIKMEERGANELDSAVKISSCLSKFYQIINWLVTDGEEMLRAHSHVGDNLTAIRTQRESFDKHYFTAMTQLEAGNELVSEADMLLGQCGGCELSSVAGLREMSKELRMRMNGFTTQLESMRETIEGTARCYALIDQCYAWALGAMTYVASMRMDKDMSTADLDALLQSLDLYLSENPPLASEVFDSMDELSGKLDNDKLAEQCTVAHTRCLETHQLLAIRQATLRKARDTTEAEMALEQERRDSVPSLNNGNGGAGAVHKNSSSHNFGPVRYRDHAHRNAWEQTVSSPVGPSLDYVSRRRSYAGKPSAPVYSPTAQAFKENLQGTSVREHEEHLLYEGLITEDMSDRIVANLPKGLSNSTMRNSRESLKGSHENVNGGSSASSSNNQGKSSVDTSNSNTQTPQASGSSSKSKLSNVRHYSAINALTVMLNKHSKPHKKVMRRAASCMVSGEAVKPEIGPQSRVFTRDNAGELKDRRTGKSLSLTTSTDSLPSMPEEDAVDRSAQSEKRHTWMAAPPPRGGSLLAHRAGVHSSMADLRHAEEDIRRRRQLQLIISELIATERDYITALQFIIDNYLPQIVRDDVPQSLRGKRNLVFGNIENIYAFHSQFFLRELEACERHPLGIGTCFLNHEQEFYLYALYNKNKPKSDHLMSEHAGRDFFRRKQSELGDKMDLSSYLLKPVQRMGKYSLLLKQVIKLCPPNLPEYADLKAAYEVVKFQLRHGNDLLAMDCLQGADVNLNEQGMLLRQDTFLVWHGRRKAMRHVFLFEEMVVFSKTRRTSLGKEFYSYKSSIKTSDLGLTENVGDNSRYKFELWFRKRTSSETFLLQSPSSDIKTDWVRDISRLLWKQAIKNREMRLAEMQRMGAGSKPCIDLKPSKDNIHDRFVNISLQSRRPKMRSSIAVSSIEHLKNGQKRPHSLISVSSSASSSGSSGMYGGGGLSITLEEAEGEADNKAIPRSETVCSNESGIVADMASPQHEDAFTQTTLRRPPKLDISAVMRGLSPVQNDKAIEDQSCLANEDNQENKNELTLNTNEHNMMTDVNSSELRPGISERLSPKTNETEIKESESSLSKTDTLVISCQTSTDTHVRCEGTVSEGGKHNSPTLMTSRTDKYICSDGVGQTSLCTDIGEPLNCNERADTQDDKTHSRSNYNERQDNLAGTGRVMVQQPRSSDHITLSKDYKLDSSIA